MSSSEKPRKAWSRLAIKAGQQDFLAAGIVAVAILMFVGVGVRVVPAAFFALLDTGGGVDRVASTALLLNVALILFSWRRYNDMRAERSRRTAAEERVEQLSSRDQLTGLLVLRSLIEAGLPAIQVARGLGRQFAMLVINLDRFKTINDVYGNLAGDSVLRGVADVIRATVPAEGFCARIASDEFAVIFPFCESARDDVSIVAENLIGKLDEPLQISGVSLHVCASVGISRTGKDCGDVEGLIRRGNIAMSAAKMAGGNRALWFDTSMESVLKARNEVEIGLRRGIPLGEFTPHYQPQVDLATGAICGFEALARWNHPAGGIVGPEMFIPVAEETGLINDLFESVLHQALEDASSWHGSLVLSVNVAPGQLRDPWLAQRILKVLTETAFPPGRLEIEITESSLFENIVVARGIVESLKNQGVRLALDDFGTGYSSLAQLRALPFDRIKIDRSFIQSMGTDAGSMAIVTAVASMGGKFGVPVTAEGIEDPALAHTLKELGCDKAQGWIYGRPLPADETMALLHSKGLLRHTISLPSDPEPARRGSWAA